MTVNKPDNKPECPSAEPWSFAQHQESAFALARLGGSEPALEAISRRQSEINPIGVGCCSNPPEASR